MWNKIVIKIVRNYKFALKQLYFSVALFRECLKHNLLILLLDLT
jgi:hypothetical protein